MAIKSKRKPPAQAAKLYTIIVRNKKKEIVATVSGLSHFAFKRRLPILEAEWLAKPHHTVTWRYGQ